MQIHGTLVTVCMVAVAVILVIAIIYIALSYPEFKGKLNYINSEINRTHGKERAHWKREKRRLIRSFLRFM